VVWLLLRFLGSELSSGQLISSSSTPGTHAKTMQPIECAAASVSLASKSRACRCDGEGVDPHLRLKAERKLGIAEVLYCFAIVDPGPCESLSFDGQQKRLLGCLGRGTAQPQAAGPQLSRLRSQLDGLRSGRDRWLVAHARRGTRERCAAAAGPCCIPYRRSLAVRQSAATQLVPRTWRDRCPPVAHDLNELCRDLSCRRRFAPMLFKSLGSLIESLCGAAKSYSS
jgi:hypothetical protein